MHVCLVIVCTDGCLTVIYNSPSLRDDYTGYRMVCTYVWLLYVLMGV